MNRARRSFVLIVFLAVAALPASCRGTQTPQIDPLPVAQERAAYERFYPYAAQDIGPRTHSAPPGFTTQRAEPVRTQRSAPLLLPY